MIQQEPLHDRIVIKRAEEAEETRSGLYIPDTAKEKLQQGEAPPSAPARFSKVGSASLQRYMFRFRRASKETSKINDEL